jgi:hypothetical protein
LGRDRIARVGADHDPIGRLFKRRRDRYGRRRYEKALLLVLVFLLAVGAGWERVDWAHVDAGDHSYSIDLPVGWIRFVSGASSIVQ